MKLILKRLLKKIKAYSESAALSDNDTRKKWPGHVSKKFILKYTSEYTTPELQSDDVALNELLVRIEVLEKKSKGITRKFIAYSFATAATVALIIGIGLFLFKNSSKINVTTASGQQISIYLPDSSEVIMNSLSTIMYKAKNWKEHRSVKLEGEAFFKVRHGSQFEINSKKCTTIVLGTSFNVFARGNQYKVNCFTGKVLVKTCDKTSERVIISGDETSLTAANVLSVPQKFDMDEAASWQRGEFYFHNEALINVFDEIERQFNVVIIDDQATNRRFTGYFNNNNLKQALKLVCEPMQLQFSIQGNRVIIEK